MNSRTILIAVLVVAAAGAAAWQFGLLDMLDSPPPKPMAVAPKPAPKAEAPQDAPKPPAGPATAEDVKAAQARVVDLEKQVADLQRQIAMKDQEIAAMMKKVGAAK